MDGLYLPPKPALIIPRQKEIVRPDDVRFKTPLILGGLLLDPYRFATTPIGTPVSLGKTNGTSGGATSVALTAGASIQAGDLVVVLIGCNSSTAGLVTSVSDGTNTYTKIDAGAEGGSPSSAELWYVANAAAVASPTITANFSSSVNWRIITALRCTGLISSPLDAHSFSTAGGSTPSTSTGTLAQANELIIGAIYGDSNFTINSTGTSFTQLAGSTTSGGSVNFEMAYRIVASTSSVTYNPTLGSSVGNVVFVAGFKGN